MVKDTKKQQERQQGPVTVYYGLKIKKAGPEQHGAAVCYYGIKKKAGFHRPMPLEAYRTYSDLGGELYIRHIQYRYTMGFSLAEFRGAGDGEFTRFRRY